MEIAAILNKPFGWRCSPNIAIVKYWGKLPGQLPASPSVSMTLDQSATETTVWFTDRLKVVEFEFDGNPAPLFAARIRSYLESVSGLLPWLLQVGVRISSRNNFPHSAGIASSASAFGALALCLADAHKHLGLVDGQQFYPLASRLARLGSGSASRSVFGGFALWGETPSVEGSSNLEAIALQPVHPVFNRMHDMIVVVSDQKKQVSSSAGHALMNRHPFAGARYEQARQRASLMPDVLAKGDLETFSRVTIAEGLGLHALMLASDPPVNLLHPLSVEVIQLADQFRLQTRLPLAYTLDAGPNVHLLYPEEMKPEMDRFSREYLAPLSGTVKIINDFCGAGPQPLSVQNND